MTIKRVGEKAEERFRRITGAQPSAQKTEGDAIIDGIPVAITTITRKSASTINQVRAVKYIPLICYHEPSNGWYVVPAHDVVRLAAAKRRGQHTENPFECATLSTRNLEKFFHPSGGDLLKAVRAAIAEASRFPKTREAMQDVLRRAQQLANESKTQVEAVLRHYDLIG